MAQINKPSNYFNTNLYTANGSGKTISGMDFQPDFVWTKNRDNASYFHALVDAVRGGTKKLFSNSTLSEETDAQAITAFNSDGYTFGSSASFNFGTNNYVNWCWKANGTGSSNTDGSITSTVSANTTSGFSIVSYTGTANSSDTVGHGLGTVPKMIIIKRRDEAGGTNWCVYHVSNNNTKVMFLESTSAGISNIRYWNNTTPTSSVFSIGNDSSLNASGGSFIAYCFSEKKGFSKFGSYTGNGSADGTFVYTGFKPAFVLFKKTSSTAANWQLWDNKRDTYNPVEKALHPDISNVASTDQDIDFLSNGFKIRGSVAHINESGVTFIYMAFAESPLVGTNNTPSTAR